MTPNNDVVPRRIIGLMLFVLVILVLLVFSCGGSNAGADEDYGVRFFDMTRPDGTVCTVAVRGYEGVAISCGGQR